MKTLNKLELTIIKAALMLDDYAFKYAYFDYKDRVGTMEIHRVRHVNNLIHIVSDNGTEFTHIIKNIAEDIDFLEHEIKETTDSELITQLNGAREILNILNEIA